MLTNEATRPLSRSPRQPLLDILQRAGWLAGSLAALIKLLIFNLFAEKAKKSRRCGAIKGEKEKLNVKFDGWEAAKPEKE